MKGLFIINPSSGRQNFIDKIKEIAGMLVIDQICNTIDVFYTVRKPLEQFRLVRIDYDAQNLVGNDRHTDNLACGIVVVFQASCKSRIVGGSLVEAEVDVTSFLVESHLRAVYALIGCRVHRISHHEEVVARQEAFLVDSLVVGRQWINIESVAVAPTPNVERLARLVDSERLEFHILKDYIIRSFGSLVVANNVSGLETIDTITVEALPPTVHTL